MVVICAYGLVYFLNNIFNIFILDNIVFQGTPIIVFIIFLVRLISSQFLDNTAINLYKINYEKKSTIFSHIVLNLINGASFSLFLFFFIIGVKNFYLRNSNIPFPAYILEISLTIFLFEAAVITFREYVIDRSIGRFLLIVTIFGLAILYIIKRLGFPVSVSWQSIILGLFFGASIIFIICYYTTKKYLFVNQTNSKLAIRRFLIFNRIRGPNRLFIKYIFTTNEWILLLTAFGGFFIFAMLYKPIQTNILYGILYCGYYYTLSEMMFAPDYKWIGYLQSGVIDLNELVGSKLNITQTIYSLLICLHLLLYLLLNVNWIRKQLPLMIFWMGTLPYILSWLEIKSFCPRDLSSSNTFDVTRNSNIKSIKFSFISIPILYLGAYLILIEEPSISNVSFLPFTIIGSLGLLFHNYWIKKLTQFYKKKRFEIFEKSEQV